MYRRNDLMSLLIMGVLLILLGILLMYIGITNKISGMNMVYFMFSIGVIEIILGIMMAIKWIKYYTRNKKNN